MASEAVNKKRELRNFRRANGLCYDCGKPTVEGRIRCELHLKKGTSRSRKLQKKHSAQKLCYNCKNPAIKGRKYCEIHKKVVSNNTKKSQQNRLSKGLCRCCPESRSPNSLYLCENHLKLANLSKSKRKAKRKKIMLRMAAIKARRIKNLEQHLCYDCPVTAAEGRIRCELHLSQNAEAIRRYQESHRLKGLCKCCPLPASTNNIWFCEKHTEIFNERRYRRRGSRSMRKPMRDKIITARTVRRFKAEPILASNWSQEVEDFIRNNAEVFKEKSDRVLFNSAELNENLDADPNSNED